MLRVLLTLGTIDVLHRAYLNFSTINWYLKSVNVSLKPLDSNFGQMDVFEWKIRNVTALAMTLFFNN